jgi:hypothetical protein
LITRTGFATRERFEETVGLKVLGRPLQKPGGYLEFVTPSYKGVKAYESPGGDLFSGAVAMDGTRGYIREQWSDGVMG